MRNRGSIVGYRRLEQDTRRLLSPMPSRPLESLVSSLLASGEITDGDIDIVERMSVGTPSMHELVQNIRTLQFLQRIQ